MLGTHFSSYGAAMAEIELNGRPQEPSTGAGEEAPGAGVAAIAHAFCDATGVRLYWRPMTPERVLAALRAT